MLPGRKTPQCIPASPSSLGRSGESSVQAARLLLPVERCCLDGRLPSVSQLLLPAWVDLVRGLLEGEECSLEFLVGLGILDHTIRQAHVSVHASLPKHPCLLTLAAGSGTLLGPVLVTESATTRSQDDVGMAEVLEECWQAESVHAARNDWGGLNHALPLLAVVGPVGHVPLQHVGDVLVRGITFHLPEAHGSHVDAAGSNDTGDLGVHEGGVPTLSLRAGDGAVAGTVVMEELPGEIPPGHCYSSSTGDVSIDEECTHLAQGTELGQDVLASSDHLCRVVSSDIRREELGRASLADARTHGLDNLWNALVHLAEDLIALRFVVFDEITTLPERVASLTERFGLQAQLRFDDGPHHQATVGHVSTENSPHVNDAAGRTVKEPQIGGRKVNVVDLSVLHIAHALIVTN